MYLKLQDSNPWPPGTGIKWLERGFQSRSFRCDEWKAYIGGWICPEYSLVRACSVFRFPQCFYCYGTSSKKGQYSKNRLFVCTLCTCRLCSMKYIISPLGSPERESLTGIKGRCRERQRISSKKFIATVYSEWGSLGNWIWFLLCMISELFAFLEQEQVFWKKIPP